MGGGVDLLVLLFFQEFEFEVIVKLGRLNYGLEHMSRIESGEETGNLDDSLPNVQLFVIKMFDDHYINIIQFFSMSYAPIEFTTA